MGFQRKVQGHEGTNSFENIRSLLFKQAQHQSKNRNIAILRKHHTMGTTKISIHKPGHLQLAAIAKVLAHPARVAILQYVSRQEGCICEDITEKIGLSQPTISQHLQVIRKAGLLQGNFKGRSLCYCIDDKAWKAAAKTLQQFFEGYKPVGQVLKRHTQQLSQ